MIVGTTIIASTISVLLRPMVDKAAEAALDHCDSMIHIKREIYNLRNTLLLIEAVIQDAEEKQVENALIREWLRRLVDIGYEARDVLDEFVTACASRGAKRASKSVIFRSLPLFSVGSGSSSDPVGLSLRFRSRTTSGVRKVRKRLDEMMRQMEIVKLLESGGSLGRIPPRRRPETGPFGDNQRNGKLVGRKDEKKEITKKLLDSNNNRVCLIPIWGMGGVGKTTIAQSIYNDERVKKEYPSQNRRWLFVGEKKFNAKEIILRIIHESGATWNDADLEDLQGKLVEKFNSDKFLIVFDDVWDVDSSEWKLLWDPLTNARKGGVIIITTRMIEVITATNTQVQNNLKPLSYKHCWSIFKSYAFVDGNSNIRPDLEHIGKRIVRKLNGLPLAAEVVGRSLLNEKNVRTWTNFLKAREWKLRNNDNDVMSALQWSYNRLPPHLKQCFVYCALFPKDHVFDEKILVEMWIAQGFIQTGECQRRQEDTGVLYFKELVNASLFQRVNGNYVMHDMIRDLALLVSNEEFATINDSQSIGQMEKARHLTIIGGRSHMRKLTLCNSKRILTLYTRFVVKNIPLDFFKQLKSIRILVLSSEKITSIPDCISDLRNLRYLDINKTRVRSLPNSTCDLHNLQTLATPIDAVLPENIVNMINLRHLRANLSTRNGFGKLTSLQELSCISICEDGNIRELRDMRQLHGKLVIKGLENVTDVQDVDRNMMQDKTYIDDLELIFNEDLGKTTIGTEVLDVLSCPPNLTGLRIVGYYGVNSPSWMADGKLIVNLRRLDVLNWGKLKLLPPLGKLKSLEFLRLNSMIEVERLGGGFYENGIHGKVFFPSLKILRLYNMPNWKAWGDCDATVEDSSVFYFPCLKELLLHDCPRLVSILPLNDPKGKRPITEVSNVMKSLSSLSVTSCDGLMWLKVDTLISLEELYVDKCFNLTTITLPTSVGTVQIMSCGNLKRMESERMPSLKKLCVYRCEKLISIPHLVAIEEMDIRYCENLRSLGINLRELDSLRQLHILGCPVLELMCEEASSCSSPSSSKLLSPLSRLRYLQTDNVLVLAKLFEHNHVYLKKMRIGNFIGVECFSQIVKNNWHKLTLLQSLRISNCKDLKSLSPEFHSLSSLKILDISSCPQLQSLAVGGLPLSLEEFVIADCKDLRLLPPEFQNLLSLKIFHISSCPQLQSLPAGGLPLSLELLDIEGCPILYERCQVDCGLDWHKIKHIQKRKILLNAERRLGFEKLGKLNGFQEIVLRGLRVECLSEVMKNYWHKLAFLETLQLIRCKDLKSLSQEFHNLSSLKFFVIRHCPQLQSLPVGGLPLSLEKLKIEGCPILYERCQVNSGLDWHKIKHIPYRIIRPASDRSEGLNINTPQITVKLF